MSISYAMRLASRFAFGVFALASLCATAYAQSEIKVLSSRPDSVSGGDAVLQVRIPPNVSVLQVVVLRNGVDVTGAFAARDLTTLEGLVGGLNVGANVILVKTQSGAILTKALVQNWPIYGPIFAGAHQRPWICETDTSGLGAPLDEHCTVPTRYDWFYRASDNTFKPLPSLTPPFPSDLVQTTTIDNHTVNYIVRVESGTIDQSIYRIAILDDPTNPISNPWSPGGKKPGPGWNGKLSYPFGGGCGPAYRSGRNTVTSALSHDPLSLGFAVAFGTRNTLGNGCDEVVSAETLMMIKERFIEQYGLPKFTIGSGGSGGSMQQHFIAQNYPGLLDAITPGVSFSDLVSILPDVTDCGLLNHYFNANPAQWPATRRPPITGYPVSTGGIETCVSWDAFAHTWVSPFNGFDPVVPVAARYNPVTNPTGARGTFTDGMVNVFGKDPTTGFARTVYDNVGMQYGLKALNNGSITVDEFLDLNERIGGLDVDGNYIPARSVADLTGVQIAYRNGVVDTAENLTLPIIDVRNYLDDLANIHTRIRTFAKLDRLQRGNGTIANEVNWLTANVGTIPNLARMALIAHNQWLENILADISTDSYAVKVIRNKPASLKDTCWDSTGIAHEETFTLTGPSVCNTLFPINSTVRIQAGGPIAGDILKCQLKPVTTSDYTVEFTPAKLVRLNMIFSQGVCDWTKPGIGQQLIADTWLRYFDPSGVWARMGHASFGND
jgi:hypothetical protein